MSNLIRVFYGYDRFNGTKANPKVKAYHLAHGMNEILKTMEQDASQTFVQSEMLGVIGSSLYQQRK